MVMMKYMPAGRIQLMVVPPHVMGGHQCLYLEQMISEAIVAMGMAVIATVRAVLKITELVALYLTRAIVCTDSIHPVSTTFQLFCLPEISFIASIRISKII